MIRFATTMTPHHYNMIKVEHYLKMIMACHRWNKINSDHRIVAIMAVQHLTRMRVAIRVDTVMRGPRVAAILASHRVGLVVILHRIAMMTAIHCFERVVLPRVAVIMAMSRGGLMITRLVPCDAVEAMHWTFREAQSHVFVLPMNVVLRWEVSTLCASSCGSTSVVTEVGVQQLLAFVVHPLPFLVMAMLIWAVSTAQLSLRAIMSKMDRALWGKHRWVVHRMAVMIHGLCLVLLFSSTSYGHEGRILRVVFVVSPVDMHEADTCPYHWVQTPYAN